MNEETPVESNGKKFRQKLTGTIIGMFCFLLTLAAKGLWPQLPDQLIENTQMYIGGAVLLLFGVNQLQKFLVTRK